MQETITRRGLKEGEKRKMGKERKGGGDSSATRTKHLNYQMSGRKAESHSHSLFFLRR